MFLLSACTDNEKLSERVSQVRSACFKGETDFFDVTAYSEMREYPIKSDGFVGETATYVILKIKPKHYDNMPINDLSADFSIDRQYSAKLLFRAEADSYVANVKVDNLPKNDLTVTITYGEKAENVPLSKVDGGEMTADKALKVAAAHKKALIDKLISEDKDFEIMIRLMLEDNSVYYYVGIVETEFTTALLISSDGKVLAEKRVKNP